MLRPGGVFVASTFLTFASPLGQLVGDELVQPLSQVGGDSVCVCVCASMCLCVCCGVVERRAMWNCVSAALELPVYGYWERDGTTCGQA